VTLPAVKMERERRSPSGDIDSGVIDRWIATETFYRTRSRTPPDLEFGQIDHDMDDIFPSADGCELRFPSRPGAES